MQLVKKQAEVKPMYEKNMNTGNEGHNCNVISSVGYSRTLDISPVCFDYEGSIEEYCNFWTREKSLANQLVSYNCGHNSE